MKQIRFLLPLMLLCGFIGPLFAQSTVEVSGKYPSGTGKWVRIKYVPNGEKRARIENLEYNGKELTKIISDYDEKILQLTNKLNKQTPPQEQNQVQPQSQSQGQNSKTEASLDTLRQRNMELLEIKRNVEKERDSLQKQVRLLEDSVRFWRDSLDKVNNQLAALLQKKTSTGTLSGLVDGGGQHIGVYYRVGCPWLINDLLNQKVGSEKFWHRKMTLSHQIGLYWNSASFSDKLPMTYGVGLEYSRLKFSAGIGQLSDSPYKFEDKDGDSCTAYLTYNNLSETVTLHYISIPLTFSIGAPRADRISGYFQVSLIPSFLLKDSLSVSGQYSCMGHYDTISGQYVNLYLTEFPDLGFVENQDVEKQRTKNSKVMNRVVFSGRLSGGVYIPLCNIAKGQTSKWVVKLGANLDLSGPYQLRKEKEGETSKNNNLDQYLSRYKIFSGSRSWSVNPSLEVGILYMFNK